MTAIFAVTCDGPAEFERWKLQAWGLCQSFGIDELLYVDKCKGDEPLGTVQFHERWIKAREVESLEAALEVARKHQPELRVVMVEGPQKMNPGQVELAAYRHRGDALYLFGGDRSDGLWRRAHGLEADWVYLDAKRGVYGYQIGPIVAWHRKTQIAARLR